MTSHLLTNVYTPAKLFIAHMNGDKSPIDSRELPFIARMLSNSLLKVLENNVELELSMGNNEGYVQRLAHSTNFYMFRGAVTPQADFKDMIEAFIKDAIKYGWSDKNFFVTDAAVIEKYLGYISDYSRE